MQGEELRAYDLLVGSLQPLKRARVERRPDLKDGGGAVGKELEEVAVDSGEDESASESDGGESRGAWVTCGSRISLVPRPKRGRRKGPGFHCVRMW